MSIECKNCLSTRNELIMDLGMHPLANALIPLNQIFRPTISYPLRLVKCKECHFVQIDYNYDPSQIFNDQYVYFSSMSEGFKKHALTFVENIVKKESLSEKSFVVEIASNDGYLLENFVNLGVPCLGIEPSSSTAKISTGKGIDTLVDFFSTKVAKNVSSKYKNADLIIANNVLAHVPDLLDFLNGIKTLLAEDGVVTIEFPHLLNIIKDRQFDTIYHEHYSYISLIALNTSLLNIGLKMVDVEEIDVHGGSLRLYISHELSKRLTSKMVNNILEKEVKFGLNSIDVYRDFAKDSKRSALNFLKYFFEKADKGCTIVGYGAAAKGNTFLNYCGINSNFITAVVDETPMKIGTILPGSGIPVVDEAELVKINPDVIIIFPWNWKEDIHKKLSKLLGSSVEIVVAMPCLEVLK